MRKLMVLTVLVVLAGCETVQTVKTTRELGALQAQYGDLVRTEAACDEGTATPEVCLGDFASVYASIEKQADEAIKTRGQGKTLSEQQITIALHRLAAFAALKSGSGQAADYADRGRALCKSVEVKPPRDCALLQVAGHYEIVNQYAADVNCLRSESGDCRRSFEDAATEFCPKIYKPLLAATGKAKAIPFLPESTTAYLEKQPLLARESQQSLADKLTDGLGFDALPREPCDCVRLDPTDPRFGEMCGNVTNERMATFRAECIRRTLDPHRYTQV